VSADIGAGLYAIFDASAVEDLTGDDHDSELATVFVTRYRRMLPGRVRRIAAALGAGDPSDAMDAALSLKVSSSTLGAHEVFELGGRIESHLRRLDLPGAVAAADELPDAAARLDRALGSYLGR
jgi:HPt (histidine-containing phosphotransfer) domain-containing protein